MVTLVLLTVLSAPPLGRLAWEQKCLYCHSEEVAEGRRLTGSEWVRLIESMRKKAPLLITRSDVPLLVRYVTQTLRLVVPRKAAVKPEVPPPERVPDVIAPPPPPALEPLTFEFEPFPDAGVTSEAERVAEEQGFALMERRCSRCHTLGRVYGKLDNLERTLTVIARMRVKTGSGITSRDQEKLEEFVRTQMQR